jgi:hypothetical protein
MGRAARPARVEDVHAIARSMPHVTVWDEGRSGSQKVVYQVGGRSFVFFRTARPDAADPETGERLTDVIVIWVRDEAEKQALIQDPDTPFFTTGHFDGHPSVLVREADLPRVRYDELRELIEEAWLSRASARRGRQWLARRESAAVDERQGT